MASAVVSGREHGKKATASEALKAIHDALVCPQNEVHFIVLQEGLDAIWSELDYVSCTVGVPHEVRLDSELAVTICWVTPQDIYDKLLFDRGDLVDDLQRPLDLFNLL